MAVKRKGTSDASKGAGAEQGPSASDQTTAARSDSSQGLSGSPGSGLATGRQGQTAGKTPVIRGFGMSETTAPGNKGPSAAVPRKPGAAAKAGQSGQAIPAAVANRMVRRVAVTTGVPTLLGMSVFIVSYVVVTRGWFELPPVVTLISSGAFFMLGLLGLSYGVLSASWEQQPGSLLGFEHFALNLGRVRGAVKAMAKSEPRP